MNGIQHRSILLRGNRFLGSALVSAGLIKREDQETASQRLLELIQADNYKQASLLHILMYELKVLGENQLINHLVERSNLGLIDLRTCQIEQSFDRAIDLGLCWATWTVPFDRVDNIHFVATAYYLSEPVVKHWETLLEGSILWFAAPTGSILDCLNRLDTEITAKAAG